MEILKYTYKVLSNLLAQGSKSTTLDFACVGGDDFYEFLYNCIELMRGARCFLLIMSQHRHEVAQARHQVQG